MTRSVWIACVLLGSIWALPGWAVELASAPVKKQQLPLERWFDGKVQAVHESTVSSETTGRVQEILFDVGDSVPAGAVILKLVSTEQQQGYNQAVAALTEARANLDVQSREFDRIQAIYQRQLVAKAEYDRANGNLSTARARVASAEAAVKGANERLSYTEVKAPYGGVVYARHVELGEAVQPGMPLMSGFDPAALRVEVDLPQAVADSVAHFKQNGVQRLARVLSDGGETIVPDKLLLFPQADPASGTVRLRLELPQQLTGLRPGQFAKVAVVVGEAERLLVPAASVVHRSEVTAVYVMTSSGPQLRQVRLGNHFGDSTSGENIEVLAGLAEGEQVALDPVAAGIASETRAKSSGAASHE